jgi:hypothetical protein
MTSIQAKNTQIKKSSQTYIKSDPSQFKDLEEALKPFTAKGRTDSASFLIWFLQNIYRLDEVDAQDAVCDKKLDKGIDAIYVSDADEEVVLFQAKRAEKIPSTLGDSDLQSFVGALAQFRSQSSVDALASTTANPDLKRILTTNNVAEKLAKGYSLRPVFVANLAANKDATDYVKLAAKSGDNIDLWDLVRIAPIVRQLNKKEWFVPETATLGVSNKLRFYEGDAAKPDLVIAAVSAKQLVQLSGIADTRIFAQNVRLGLGNTRVNIDLARSIGESKEHDKFIAYHNGMTLVARDIALSSGKVEFTNYSVCNGCQSLMTLYNNQSSLTSKLNILVRIVKVGDDRSLAGSIAYKTNNQNPISLRDLSANNATQLHIKAEFDELYGFDCKYQIKRGEEATKKDLPNEYAGQLLMSIFTREPWSAHQKYKVFGELQGDIFKYGIGAEHIRLAQLAMCVCETALEGCENKKVKSYGLTRFILLYLIGEILRKEKQGTSLLDDPREYMQQSVTDIQRRKRQISLNKSLKEIADYVVLELNFYIDENGGDQYDYKSDFKSEKKVGTIRSEVLKSFEKDKRRGKALEFSLPN